MVTVGIPCFLFLRLLDEGGMFHESLHYLAPHGQVGFLRFGFRFLFGSRFKKLGKDLFQVIQSALFIP